MKHLNDLVDDIRQAASQDANYREVATQPLWEIVKALHVVLRRYGMGRRAAG